MKKGINSWSFPPMGIKEMLALASKAGFDGMELCLNAEGELSFSSTEREILAIRSMAEDLGLSLYSLTCGQCWKYWLNDDEKENRERAKTNVVKQMETAKLLGADTVLVIPGVVNADFARPGARIPYQDAYDRSLESLLSLKETAEKLHIHIGLENVWNKFLLSPMEMKDFIDKIGSDHIGSYLDIGNTLFAGYPDDWIRILNGRIKKVHFKDYRISVGGLDGFVELLTGDVDYPAVMQAFAEVGYDGWVTAEMTPGSPDYGEALIRNTSRSMDYILGR